MSKDVSVYRSMKVSILGVVSGVLLISILLLLFLNLNEGSKTKFFSTEYREVPKYLIHASKIMILMACLYIFPHFIGRIIGLFHIVPLLSFEEKQLRIRKLFSVQSIPWEDIVKVDLVENMTIGNRGTWLKVQYNQLQKKENLLKEFNCNASVLTLSIENIKQKFSENVPIFGGP